MRVLCKDIQLAQNKALDIPGQVFDFHVLEMLQLDSVQDYCTEKSHQTEDKVSAVLQFTVALLDDIVMMN